MAPIGVVNLSSLHENTIIRTVAALPFLVLLSWAFISSNGLHLSSPITAHIDSIILSGRFRFGTISIPILNKFLDIKVLDDFWRPKAVAFAPSTLGADPVSWFQNISFLVDYSLIYSIWLFESARKANEYSPARFPVLFGLLAQVFGIGLIAPLYFFLHYVNAPLRLSTTPGKRDIDHYFSRAIFLTLGLFSYLPVFLMFLGPSPSVRHRWTWAWQMFPIWVSVAQWIRTQTSASTSKVEQLPTNLESNISDNGSNIVRATISAFAAVSAGVWIYMLLNSPYSVATIFLPQEITETAFIPLMRKHLQISHLSTSGSALMWLVYLFSELKNAHLVHQSWISLLAAGGLMITCFGPGATLAAGWYWREEILRREEKGGNEGSVADENGKGRYKKLARQNLDELCFGGTKGRFKVL